MIQKKYIAVVAILLVVVALVFYSVNKKNNQTVIPVANQAAYQPQTVTPSTTPTELPSPIAAMVSNTMAPVPGGPTRGQVTCNYQIPATTTQFGTVSIEYNWNNLVPGKNGATKLALCVSVNGNNSLMMLDTRANGSLTTSAPWISLNTDYAFNLYDDRGGDSSDCGGTILSTCHVSQNFATAGPISAPGRH